MSKFVATLKNSKYFFVLISCLLITSIIVLCVGVTSGKFSAEKSFFVSVEIGTTSAPIGDPGSPESPGIIQNNSSSSVNSKPFIATVPATEPINNSQKAVVPSVEETTVAEETTTVAENTENAENGDDTQNTGELDDAQINNEFDEPATQ